jgi:hypothetical protein
VFQLEKTEADIQQPIAVFKDGKVYAHRTVSEDGEVIVEEIRPRSRKDGATTEWYDNPLDPEARSEMMKKIGGSSIGWDTDSDGLGGSE